MNIKLIRYKYDKGYILGAIVDKDGDLDINTLELPWKDNKNGISCIPNRRKYTVKKRYTKSRGWHFHVTKVPGRTWILIHPANYTRQIRGCIAPGITHADIDGDGVIDITSSRKAMKILLKYLPDEFEMDVL